MKRFLSILLVAVLIVTSMSVAVFAAGSASASVSKSQTVKAGDEVTLTVTVSGEFSNYEMKVTADSGLTITAITGVTANVKNGKVAYSSGINVTEHSFKVTVKVADDAKPGSYKVTATPTYGCVIVDPSQDTEDGYVDGRVEVSLKASSATLTIECEHVWGEWTVTEEATCSKEGLKERICSICGEKQTKKIDKTEHTWSDWTVTEEATCSKEGSKTRTCSVCGETETKKIEKAAHNWGEWKTVKEATCTEDGKKERTCAVCGEKQTEVIPAADGHKWGEWTTEKEPTCTEDGLKTRTCSVCGEKGEEAIPATGHQFVCDDDHWMGDKTHHWHECSVCGEKCEVDYAEHVAAEGYIVVKEPTAKEDGLEVLFCEICGYEMDSRVIPANGGTPDPGPGKTGDPTDMLMMIGGLSLMLLILLAVALYMIKRKASAK